MVTGKERLPYSQETNDNKQAPVVDVEKGREVMVPREVASWLEKVEKLTDDKQSDVTDDKGVKVLSGVNLGETVVKLPVSRSVFASGFKKTVSDAGRFLSAFFLRVIKIKKGRVKFEDES